MHTNNGCTLKLFNITSRVLHQLNWGRQPGWQHLVSKTEADNMWHKMQLERTTVGFLRGSQHRKTGCRCCLLASSSIVCTIMHRLSCTQRAAYQCHSNIRNILRTEPGPCASHRATKSLMGDDVEAPGESVNEASSSNDVHTVYRCLTAHSRTAIGVAFFTTTLNSGSNLYCRTACTSFCTTRKPVQ